MPLRSPTRLLDRTLRRVVGLVIAVTAVTAVLVASPLASTSSARAQGNPFTISVDDLTLEDPRGETTVLLRLDPDDDGVAALTVDVTADASLVQVVRVEVPGDAGLCAFSNGVVRFAGFNVDPDGWSEPVDLCAITYRGLGTAGTGAFDIDVRNAVSTQVSNGRPVEIEGTLAPGTIRVGAPEPTVPSSPDGPPATIDPAPTRTTSPQPSPTPEPPATAEPTTTTEPTTPPAEAPDPTATAEPAGPGTAPTPESDPAGRAPGERGLRAVAPPEPARTPESGQDDHAEPSGPEPTETAPEESSDDAVEPAAAGDPDPSPIRVASTPDEDFPAALFGAIAAGLFAAGAGLTIAGRRYPPA